MCDDHSTVPVEIVGASPRGGLGTARMIDGCIADLVRRLNETGMGTLASCCGHNKRPGNIVLADRRELFIIPDFDTGRALDDVFDTFFKYPDERVPARRFLEAFQAATSDG